MSTGKESEPEDPEDNRADGSDLCSWVRSTPLRTLNEDGELWLAYEGLKETNR